MQPFQGKKLKIPHRASSQQTDAALSRLQVLVCRMNPFSEFPGAAQRYRLVKIFHSIGISSYPQKLISSLLRHLYKGMAGASEYKHPATGRTPPPFGACMKIVKIISLQGSRPVPATPGLTASRSVPRGVSLAELILTSPCDRSTSNSEPA